MPASMVRQFADPDEYAASIRATTAEFSITKPGRFAAKLIRIDLHRLWMQRFAETLPRVCHLDCDPNRAIISFQANPGPNVQYTGREAQPTAIMRHSRGHSFIHRSTGPAHFASLSLPIAEMAALGATYGDCDFTPPRDALLICPAPNAMQRLRRLHAAAAHLAEQAPEVIAEPEAAHGLEQALIAATADCLSMTGSFSPEFTDRRREMIMKRFWTMLKATPDRVLHVPEMCRQLGISNRTLTTCCNSALGMSPHRFMRVRQLNITRRALALADQATATVTNIATAHGFWELGRFAVAYRALFGEHPSTTLRRAPGDDGGSGELADFPVAASEFA